MFSKELTHLLENDLRNTNYGRILLLKKFQKLVLENELKKDLKVAVVGGSIKEPELLLLNELGFNLNVITLGIEEDDDILLDLNKENEIPEDLEFDLVLCCQVLEHIWNANKFASNIIKIMGQSTYAFIHCPKSNIDHGHTFYSAGYSKEFLEIIFGEKITITECGELGTPRLYTSIHLLKEWITKREAFSGKISYRTWFSFLWNLNNSKPKSTKYTQLIKYRLSYKKFIVQTVLKLLSNSENDDKLTKTESYIFFKLRN